MSDPEAAEEATPSLNRSTEGSRESQDLTSLLQAERNRALQELAVGIRHEVSNTLGALLANAQVLAESPGLDAEDRESACAIQREVLRLAEVTERLQRVEELPRVPYLGSVVMIDLSAPKLLNGAGA